MVSSDDVDQLKRSSFATGGNLKDYLEDEGQTELIAPALKAGFSLAASQTNAERALLRYETCID